MISVLDQVLRLLHPFMPFITEEIWQSVKPLSSNTYTDGNLLVQAFPEYDLSTIDTDAETVIDWLKAVVIGIRTIRSENNIAPSKPLEVLFAKGNQSHREMTASQTDYLSKLAKLESIRWLEANEQAPAAATALAGDMEILIPMAGLINKDDELERLGKEIDKLENELKRLGGKLSNENFVAKAPEAVVAKERAKQADSEAALAKLIEKRTQIESL